MSDYLSDMIRLKFARMLQEYQGINFENERRREELQSRLASEFRLTKEDIRRILTEERVFPRKR